MASVSLEPEALADIDEAHNWYERRQPGLGDRFEDHPDDVFEWILSNLKACSEVRPGIRKHNLRTFPYTVYFRAVPQGIVVFAVLHGARHPGRWKRRF
ncbi:MAG: type II toxin-antitoxin system RelE/ParE family toxin [Planctomycetes bacterium]|nr:type II toxin-antitoxin system RelE/ParE family toxin [Planctomycetota bacterium]